MFTQFTEVLYTQIQKIQFDNLVLGVWSSYAIVFAVAFIAAIASERIRAASKRPFLCLTNAYAGVTLALFLLKVSFSQSVFAAAIFWVAGYLLYGLLCAVSPKKEEPRRVQPPVTVIPAAPVTNVPRVRADVPVAKNNVRLDHAVQVTEKLLTKNLGKSDRQELEKLKNTLAVLQIKGTLSTAESDILNENFNTLLKLMAKYNV